jgi:hypothetical protein
MNEVVIAAGTNGRQYWRDLCGIESSFGFLLGAILWSATSLTVVGVAWSWICTLLTMLILAVRQNWEDGDSRCCIFNCSCAEATMR